MTMLTFAVRRREPVLVRPAVATPQETKLLSDIDDQEFLRRYVPALFFYRGGVQQDEDRDPAAVIRRALGEALVPYYPLAGRLREIEGGKLVVDCTGEGVLFAEADADVRLAELEAAGLRPPFPYLDKLLLDLEGSSGVVNLPLLLVQVTRLLCGGFVVALVSSHTVCDGTGTIQFMSAVAELARGLPSPTIAPAWSRQLLQVHDPSKPPSQSSIEASCRPKKKMPTSGGEKKVMRTFSFSKTEIGTVKTCLPPHLRKTATTFEVLTAALWRARTAALELPPDEQVSLLFYFNIRGVRELALPAGYYGNAIVISAAVTTSGELLARSLGDTVRQVQEAKAAVTAAFVRSTTNPQRQAALRRWLDWASPGTFRVSDIRHAGFHHVDFGWGQPVYCGRTDAHYDVSFLQAAKDGDGENAVTVSMLLPRATMDRFASKVQMLCC